MCKLSLTVLFTVRMTCPVSMLLVLTAAVIDALMGQLVLDVSANKLDSKSIDMLKAYLKVSSYYIYGCRSKISYYMVITTDPGVHSKRIATTEI